MATSSAPAVAPSTTPTRAPASLLAGLTLPDGWKVIKSLPLGPGCTGGNFSVGYLVEKNSTEAFLKALDFSGALRAPDPARALQALTEAYNFERDVLIRCKDHRMTRVVAAIADGSVNVPTPTGPEIVQYLILEKAECDSRSFVLAGRAFDTAWGLRALRHIATGLRQMHGHGMAHQDVKPSNVLVFGG